MLNEKDILNLLQEYVRTPEAKKWIAGQYGVTIGGFDSVVNDIKQELIAAITAVLPNFNTSAIHCLREDRDEKNSRYSIVKIENNSRSIVFGDTVVRVSPKFALAMHIDTDEANAACAFGTCYGEIVK